MNGKIHVQSVLLTFVPPPLNFGWAIPRTFVPNMFDLRDEIRIFTHRDRYKKTRKRGDLNRLLETRFPARTNQPLPTDVFHLLPRRVIWSSNNPQELTSDLSG